MSNPLALSSRHQLRSRSRRAQRHILRIDRHHEAPGRGHRRGLRRRRPARQHRDPRRYPAFRRPRNAPQHHPWRRRPVSL